MPSFVVQPQGMIKTKENLTSVPGELQINHVQIKS